MKRMWRNGRRRGLKIRFFGVSGGFISFHLVHESIGKMGSECGFSRFDRPVLQKASVAQNVAQLVAQNVTQNVAQDFPTVALPERGEIDRNHPWAGFCFPGRITGREDCPVIQGNPSSNPLANSGS